MQDVELKGIWEEQLNVFKGILFNNRDFAEGGEASITYDFDNPQLAMLKEKYNIYDIAKQGGEFERAKRIMQYFAPRLAHDGNFKNKVGCNAIDLLEYSLDNIDNGINCLNKSKILQECCLSVGIYARRVWLMPYSPYDEDNHVVVEIFDAGFQKWIMLDMTSIGYFVDENNLPLSVLEIRNNFALNRCCDFIKCAPLDTRYFIDMEMEKLYYSQYFAKNLFYFYIENRCAFGDNNARLAIIPKNFDLSRQAAQNMKFKSDVAHENFDYNREPTTILNDINICGVKVLEDNPYNVK